MNIEKLAKIKNFCYSVAKMPTDYIEAMTPYELLNWFCDYLKNTIIPKINEQISEIEEYKSKYDEFTANVNEDIEELETFVNNYFDNLDVQDEINNKIDELVEDGTMDSLLNTNLTGQLTDLATTSKDNLVSAINEVDFALQTKAEESDVYNKNEVNVELNKRIEWADIGIVHATGMGILQVAYPTGFNQNNCKIISFMYDKRTAMGGDQGFRVDLGPENILIVGDATSRTYDVLLLLS